MKSKEEILAEINRKEMSKINKGNKTTMLNYYNKVLNEFFSVKEALTQENKSKIFLVYNSCNENEINFTEFIQDLISNWEKYHRELKLPKWIMYPKLDFIAKERVMFIFGYKKFKETGIKIKKEKLIWE